MEAPTMALKKSKIEAAPAPKKAATKTTKAKKAAPKKAAADTATKTATPKAAAKKAAPKAAAKKPAPVKLTDKQAEFLKAIHSAGEAGYKGDKKAEAKAIDALLGKKLIKKGAKDKATGVFVYTVSKAGEKHLSTPAPSAS
jgi:hypothetical protein